MHRNEFRYSYFHTAHSYSTQVMYFHCAVPVRFSLCLFHNMVLLVFIVPSQPIETITIVRYPNRAKIHECVIVNHARQGPSPPSLLSPLISLNPGTAAPGFSSLWTKEDGWTWGGDQRRLCYILLFIESDTVRNKGLVNTMKTISYVQIWWLSVGKTKKSNLRCATAVSLL